MPLNMLEKIQCLQRFSDESYLPLKIQVTLYSEPLFQDWFGKSFVRCSSCNRRNVTGGFSMLTQLLKKEKEREDPLCPSSDRYYFFFRPSCYVIIISALGFHCLVAVSYWFSVLCLLYLMLLTMLQCTRSYIRCWSCSCRRTCEVYSPLVDDKCVYIYTFY